jgi:gluconokinase
LRLIPIEIQKKAQGNGMVIIVMGVSGSGKTTIGQRLAELLNWQFGDADDFHPSANIAKMRQGIPLDDADRQPWLQALQAAIHHWLSTNTNAILACSALKSSYRQLLGQSSDQVHFVYLKGSFELIQQRLSQRQNHYMKADLLQSQFATLEEPDQTTLLLDIAQSPDTIAQQIMANLQIVPSGDRSINQ